LLVVLGVLLEGVGYSISAASPALLQTAQKPPTDAERLAALQLSQACRDAGDKFWQRGGFAGQPGFMGDYMTHYNRQLSKCLIRLVKFDEPARKEMFMMVFDAVEDNIIASQMAKWDGKDYVVTYLDSYDGKHKHEPPTAYPSDESRPTATVEAAPMLIQRNGAIYRPPRIQCR
jgi:hypothetical protein